MKLASTSLPEKRHLSTLTEAQTTSSIMSTTPTSLPVEVALNIVDLSRPATLDIVPHLYNGTYLSKDYMGVRNAQDWAAFQSVQSINLEVLCRSSLSLLNARNTRVLLDLRHYNHYRNGTIPRHPAPDALLQSFTQFEVRIPFLFTPGVLSLYTAIFTLDPIHGWKVEDCWTPASPRLWAFLVRKISDLDPAVPVDLTMFQQQVGEIVVEEVKAILGPTGTPSTEEIAFLIQELEDMDTWVTPQLYLGKPMLTKLNAGIFWYQYVSAGRFGWFFQAVYALGIVDHLEDAFSWSLTPRQRQVWDLWPDALLALIVVGVAFLVKLVIFG